MNKHKRNYIRSGFTIIEIVLVLAIAGLIFLMIFIALPALQRSQRNQSYKNNVSMAISLIQRYRSNNNNALIPTIHTDAGFTTGQNNPEYSTHPLRNYIDSAGVADGINFKVWRLGPTSDLTLTSRNFGSTFYGRILIIERSKCPLNGNWGDGYHFVYSQSSTTVSTVLEEGDRLLYCQEI